MSSTETITKIKATVRFPVSKKGPFVHGYSRETTVAVVLAAAMAHFGVMDDAQFTYVLTHGGQQQKPDATLGSIAREAHALEFRLVKVITQG